MPIYEYKGVQFEAPEGYEDWGAVTKWIDGMGDKASVPETPAKTPEKTTWGQDMGIGLENLAHTGKTALDLLAGGLESAVTGGTSVFDDMTERRRAREEEMKGYDQGFGGKAVSALTAGLPALATIPFGLPAAVAAGVGMGGASALEGSVGNIEAGATPWQAGKQAIGETVTDTLANLLPVGKGIKAGTLLGAGGNIGSQAMADVMARGNLNQEAIDKNYHAGMDQETFEKYALSGIAGAVPGAAFGHIEGTRPRPNTTTTPPPPDVANTRLGLETQDQATAANIARSNTARDIITIKLDEAQTSYEKTKEFIADLINKPVRTPRQEEALASAQARIAEQQTRVLKLKEELKLHEDTLARYAPPLEEPPIAPVAGQQPPVDAGIPPRPIEPAVEPVRATSEPVESPNAPRVSNIDDFAASVDSMDLGGLVPRPVEPVDRTPTPMDDPRLQNDTMQYDLSALRGEMGWAEKGGYLIRAWSEHGPQMGEVTGRTKWIPFSDYWPSRPKNVSLKEAQKFVEDAINGEPLPPKGKAFIEHALDYIEARQRKANEPEKTDSAIEFEIQQQRKAEEVDQALAAQAAANQSAPPLTPPAPVPNPPQPSGVGATPPNTAPPGMPPPNAGMPPPQPPPQQPPPAQGSVRGAPVTVEYDITKPMSLQAIRDAIVNGVWKDPKGFANNIFSKIQAGYFGSQQAMLGLKDKYPLAFQAYIQTNLANHVAERYRRSWLYDLDASNIHQGAVGKGLMKVFMNLKESTNPDSVHNLLKKGKDTTANLVEILKMAQEARSQGITHSAHMASNPGRLTPHQVKMYTALEKMWNRMQQDAGTPYIAGWFPAVRHGDFGAWIKDKFGTPFRIETFKTALERDQFIAKHANPQTGFSAESVNKKDSPKLFEQLSLINDMLGRNLTPDKKQALDTIEKVRQAMAGNAGLGSHALHRRDFAGFEGNKLGKTALQNAEDWHQAIFDSVDDFAVQWKKRHLTQVAEAFTKDPVMKAAAPQQVEMAEAVFNNAMRITKEGSISEKMEDIGDSINHIANTSLVKLQQAIFKDPDLKASRRDVIHNAVSYPARLFYLNILMKRPAFWISTVLTSPMAVSRQLFRDGKPMETLKAVAAGTYSMMHGMSVEKRKFMREAANESEIFGHSLTLETQEAGGVDMSKRFKKDTLDMIDGVGWITGSIPAKKAEALSRLWAASIGYEYYKDKFPRNPGALKLQVEHFVATTMVLYGAEHSSPLLQKAGVLGQAAGQLTKYPTAQLGNLIADFQHIKKSDYKTYLPVVSTLLGSMIAGGTAGTALVAEYEILASIFNKMAEFLGLDIKAPSAVRAMYENTNPVQQTLAKGYGWLGADDDKALKMAQLGVPSGLAGMDIGSGLRTQSYLSKLVTDPTSGIFDAMPAISWAKEQIGAVGTMLNSQSNEAEKRKAMMDAGIPVVGSKAIIDRFGYGAGDRQYVPDNKTGAASVEQTIKEEIATALGTRTTSTAIDTGRGFLETKQLRADKDKQRQVIELAVDDLIAGREMRLDPVIKAYEKTAASGEAMSKAIRSAIDNALRKRYMDQASRFKYGVDDNISKEDMVKILRYEKVEE